MFKEFFLLLLCCAPVYLSAQYQLQWQPEDTTEAFVREAFPDHPSFWADTLALKAAIIAGVRQLHSEAFAEASVDRLVQKDSTFIAMLHVGPAYRWVDLSNGNIPSSTLDAAGFRERLYRNKPLRYPQLRKLQDALLDYAENHGYPFAKVWLDSITIRQGEVAAQLMMDRGPLVLVKELDLKGDAKIGQAFMENYLGIAPGRPYNNQQVRRIRNRIQELPFLTLAEDPVVNFIEQEAIIRLPLGKKRASRFDFVLGVLPQNESGRQLNDRTVLVTGTFKGELQNQFGRGERIYASFEQLRPETQELELEFNYPFVLGLPFGVDFSFDLYKRDTSYLDLESDLGIQYLFEGGNYLKVFWNNRSSTLLTVDETRLQLQERLPENLDVSNAYFGLEYALQRLDYRFNPRKGWAVRLRGGAGVRRIERNNRILELGYGELYDTLALRSFQYKLSGQVEGYLPLFNRSTVLARLRGGAILSETPVYFNEQFRIGGNQILRGFDEESIFATRYALSTIEYRLLIGQNSYLYTFGDVAYVEDITPVKDVTDWPYGFGAGITFETGVGLFGVSLAYGKQLNNPIDFSAPKVHFGYVSLFN
ncbi:MAG: BamA/TamA family outer membrane protein [Phaeodactylibacter sp.]|uniref:BamA/TamA family outer membrane protein n=1 Tax=Phaeodactylibacter sp. TaxID=1940289 RepID=UPI0032EFF16A